MSSLARLLQTLGRSGAAGPAWRARWRRCRGAGQRARHCPSLYLNQAGGQAAAAILAHPFISSNRTSQASCVECSRSPPWHRRGVGMAIPPPSCAQEGGGIFPSPLLCHLSGRCLRHRTGGGRDNSRPPPVWSRLAPVSRPAPVQRPITLEY